MEANTRRLEQLTLEQEQAFADDPRLLLICNLALNGWSFDEILWGYDFDKASLTKLLLQLQHYGVIELTPLNKIRLRISPGFSWRPNGPVQKLFIKTMASDFFDSSFEDEDRSLNVVVSMVSQETARDIKKKLRDLELQIIQQCQHDRTLPIKDKMYIGLVMGMRPWRLSLFDRVRTEKVNWYDTEHRSSVKEPMPSSESA